MTTSLGTGTPTLAISLIGLVGCNTITDLDVPCPQRFRGGHSAREALLAEEPDRVFVRVGQQVLAVVRARDVLLWTVSAPKRLVKVS